MKTEFIDPEYFALYISPDSTLAGKIEQRIDARKILRLAVAGVLIIESGCGFAGGVVVDSNARQGMMDGLTSSGTSHSIEHSQSDNPETKTEPKKPSANTGYCPPPEKLSDGTDRFRVRVSEFCPEQVVPVGEAGWLTFRRNSVGYEVGGNVAVDSVATDGPDSWIVDP